MIGTPSPGAINRIKTTLTANGTFVVPAGHFVLGVFVQNTTANAVTGGIRFGTTDGGVDVIVALTVGANALAPVTDAAMLKRVFSMSSNTTIYAQAVVAWNSASVNIYVLTVPLT